MTSPADDHEQHSRKHLIGLIAGVVLALVVWLGFDLVPGHPEVTRTAAVAVLMATWWITEAIPIPATALIPVALFPLMGIMNGKAVAATYFNNIIFLFIGGFIMALAMERWNLHRRIALRIIVLIGTSPRRILLGFMVATAFLSMWISNTATTMMMVPIALAIIFKLKEEHPGPAMSKFAAGLLIGIAYSASIGGIATLIGTPPNLAFSRIYAIQFPQAPEISFAGWFVFGFPFSVVFLGIAWWLLSALFIRGHQDAQADPAVFKAERKRLGPMSYEEKVVLVFFVALALLWLFRQNISLGAFTIPGWSHWFPESKFIDDGTIAIAVSLFLFLIPSRARAGERLMNWETAVKLHWGIIILFGGGFALAAGFESSGLSTWVTQRLEILSGVPIVVMVAVTCILLTFLTELTSNTATTQLSLPLLAALAAAIKVHPLLLMIPATLSASCAFMLPVATPPNAIVFGSGAVRMSDMMRSGILMNLIGVVLITAFMYAVGLSIFGIDPSHVPAWAM